MYIEMNGTHVYCQDNRSSSWAETFYFQITFNEAYWSQEWYSERSKEAQACHQQKFSEETPTEQKISVQSKFNNHYEYRDTSPNSKAGRLVGESRLLCGCSVSRQCNIFIGCKPHSHSSHTVRKPTTMKLWSSTTVAQHGPHNLEVVGLNPTRVSVFSHVCAHFDMMQYNATCYSATSECRQVNRNLRIGN